MRRVEEAKKIMEAEMLQEMERRKQEQLEEAKRREVWVVLLCLSFSLCFTAATAGLGKATCEFETRFDRRPRRNELFRSIAKNYCLELERDD